MTVVLSLVAVAQGGESESVGSQLLDLRAPERCGRVMSDAEFAPPTVAIGDETPRANQMIGSANCAAGLHLAFTSQLIWPPRVTAVEQAFRAVERQVMAERRRMKSYSRSPSARLNYSHGILNAYNNFILKSVHEYILCAKLFCIHSGPPWPCSDTRCYRLLSWPLLLPRRLYLKPPCSYK